MFVSYELPVLEKHLTQHRGAYKEEKRVLTLRLCLLHIVSTCHTWSGNLITSIEMILSVKPSAVFHMADQRTCQCPRIPDKERRIDFNNAVRSTVLFAFTSFCLFLLLLRVLCLFLSFILFSVYIGKVQRW